MPERALIALSIATRSNGTAPELPTFRGFQLAMEAAQSLDLPAPIDWVAFDDHGDAHQAELLADTIVANPEFIGVVGPMGSTEAFANAPVFDAAGLLQVSPCASHPDLCSQGYDTFYRVLPNEDVQGGALARLARGELSASTAAIVHDTDAFGTAVAERFERFFTEDGGTIARTESFDMGDTAFGPLATRIVDSEPDIVFFAVHATEGLAVSAAIREAGATMPFLGTDGLKTSFFLGGGTADAEAYHTHSGADFRRLDTAADFRSAYTARWPEDSTYSPEAYDAAMMIVTAFAQAGSVDRTAVLDAFRARDTYQGITGPVRFHDNGERRDSPVSWYRVVSGDDGRNMQYQGIVT